MVRRFFSQAWLYHKARRAVVSWEEFLLLEAGYPLLTLIFYCLLASYSFRTGDLTRWVIGNAFLLCVYNCIFGQGVMFTQERYHGRLRSIVAAPASVLGVVLASGFFPALISAATVAAGFFLGAALFGVPFAGVNLGQVAVCILCSMATATCFGLMLSVLALMTGSMHLVLNIVQYVLMIFTGAEFPVEQLPVWGRLFSRLLPMTHGMEAMNLLFSPDNRGFWMLCVKELCLGASYAALACGIFRIAEAAARKRGQFDLF